MDPRAGVVGRYGYNVVLNDHLAVVSWGGASAKMNDRAVACTGDTNIVDPQCKALQKDILLYARVGRIDQAETARIFRGVYGDHVRIEVAQS